MNRVDAREKAKARALAMVNERRDEAVDLLCQMVRIPSYNPPGNEKALADFNAQYLRSIGFAVAQIEPVPLRASNIGRLKGRTGKPTLLFNSHLDTMPPGDPSNWTYPPTCGEVHDGYIWGLGAKNMKSGMASAMFAARILRDCDIQLDGDLLITQTADEIQLGSIGLGELVKSGMVKADFAVYTECDPPLKVEIAHRGVVWLDITVKGYATHTTDAWAHKSVNALQKTARVIDALSNLKFVNWKPHPYLPGEPFMSPNMVIDTGIAKNTVPDKITVRWDCRWIPPQTSQTVIEEVNRELDRLRAEDPDLKVEVSVFHEGESSEISPHEPIVKAMQAAIKEVTGEDVPVGGVASCSDARWLILYAGIPTCKFMFPSMGSETNERERIEDYLTTIKVYVTLIDNLLA